MSEKNMSTKNNNNNNSSKKKTKKKMTLSADESVKLFNLLRAADQRPFLEIVSDFESSFPALSFSQFVTSFSLSTLLQDKKMLNPAQRLVGFAILHQAYNNKSSANSNNPFLPLLLLVLVMKKLKDMRGHLFSSYYPLIPLPLLTPKSGALVCSFQQFLKQSASD
ncbi:hypothetical protein L484_020409 [Morus notabilis]|uniref:CCR4-NOT transcription complex subunit 11 n=1 Tax=Morus notabilis TaxID=981085 RepID=W9RNC3_9ROSA|nr:hypothetical protein L484_020409 [Morus notabilis]